MFIIIGVDIILKFLFKISLPLFKIFFALFFIYMGLSILLGRNMFGSKNCRWQEASDMFGEFTSSYSERVLEKENISVIFGSKSVDLTGMKIKEGRAYIKADCVFGQLKIKLDPQMPVRIYGSSAFGQVTLPDNNKSVFGSNKYESENLDTGKPYLELEVSAVFGETVVIR